MAAENPLTNIKVKNGLLPTALVFQTYVEMWVMIRLHNAGHHFLAK